MVAALAGGIFPSAVEAQRVSSPIIVVVESDFQGTDASQIRESIESATGSPVIRLSDRQADHARGTLSIAVSRDGRHAHVYFRLARGSEQAVLVEVVAGRGADAAGRWLAEPSAALIRTLDQWVTLHVESEVLDPWLYERVQPTAPGEIHILSELADPFVGEPTGDVEIVVDRYYYGSEVLNPWAQANNPESAERLGTPRPPSR